MPQFLLQGLVEGECTHNRGGGNGIGLPREVLVINPAHRDNNREGEGNPRNGDPRSRCCLE